MRARAHLTRLFGLGNKRHDAMQKESRIENTKYYRILEIMSGSGC